MWTIIVWAVFPIKFAVYMSKAMTLETDVIIGCFCDIAAKVRQENTPLELWSPIFLFFLTTGSWTSF